MVNVRIPYKLPGRALVSVDERVTGHRIRTVVIGPGDSSTDPAVRLTGLRKAFADIVALDDVSLTIPAGEFFTMLGPSGSGKTTMLRVIAGFERPDTGSVELLGVDVTRRPPYERDVNTVFQDYALFPHMSVQENVEYGLRVQRVDRGARRKRAAETLAMVGLEGLGGRKPAQLSGGQRQRVALARAIVNSPAVLVLDEPLGALDLKLRQGMQLELKRIQREVGITFIYVTHDQEEALTMSDRIAVFNRGRIEQVGTPVEIYDAPTTEFVAGFVGVSNLLSHHGRTLAIRPERVHLFAPDAKPPAGAVVESGSITDTVFLGVLTRYTVRLDSGATLVAVRPNLERGSLSAKDPRGAPVLVAWHLDQATDIEPSVTADPPLEESA
jgi:putative spermidine/putrescine transport system ATP-binding protein